MFQMQGNQCLEAGLSMNE